jgi:N-acetylglucosamine-6-phosphate deacetylase
VDASRMASGTPATVLGRYDQLGSLAPGKRADLVLLDDKLTVTGVLRGGAPYLDERGVGGWLARAI